MAISRSLYDAPNIPTGPGLVMNNTSWLPTLELDLNANKDFQDLKVRISEIEKRLYILQPNKDLEEKFESLKEAYNTYKIIEGLLASGKS